MQEKLLRVETQAAKFQKIITESPAEIVLTEMVSLT